MKTRADTSAESDYPLRSDYFEVDTSAERNTALKLCNVFYKLGKIKTWLTLESSSDKNKFPYQLYLKNISSGIEVQSGTVVEGEKFQLMLVKDKKDVIADSIEKRWVYVFYISEQGDIQILFPSGDNIENFYPVHTNSPEEILPVNPTPTVGEPFGIDHILMLTTTEALPNPIAGTGAGDHEIHLVEVDHL